MSKLLVSCGTLSSGGAERVLSTLSKAFADNFDQVVYLTWIEMPDFYPLDERIKRVCVEKESGCSNILKKSLWFRKYVRREGFSLILSFLEPFNVLICGLLVGIDISVIVADRNDPHWIWNKYWQRELRQWSYRKAKGIVCQTENNSRYYKNKLFEKTHVIYNPIFIPDEYRGLALSSEKRNRVVSVARLQDQKNLKMMIRAFSLFQQTHKDFILTIYGEGPARNELEDFIQQNNLQHCIELPGAKYNVWDLILDSKCFLLSSWYEGMPNALMEAMCLGLPCISTKVSGAVDFIKDGENGFLVDLDDEKSMADCLERLASDNTLAQYLGEKATKIFDILLQEKISKEWVDYLMSFVKNKI